MNSLTIEYLKNLKLTADHASTLRTIGECKGKQDLFAQQTPETLETLKKQAIIESSKCSNRLEGITAADHRIEALINKGSQPQNRSEQEIAGYRDALDMIHGAAQHMDMTCNIILQLHSVIYRYHPGEGGKWKTVDNEIIEKNPDGSTKRIRFTPTGSIATPSAMQSLADRYQVVINRHHQEPLVVIPLTILDFLCIHPFMDGNGRVARLLTLLLLYHFSYQVGQYISLERIFEESKESYYETLERSSQWWHEGQHDCFPWMTYFWGVLLRAYREFEERVGTIRTFRGSKTEQIRQVIHRTIGPFAISDIEADCHGISRDMIRIVLRQLRDEGAILPKGKGRGAKWIRKKD